MIIGVTPFEMSLAKMNVFYIFIDNTNSDMQTYHTTSIIDNPNDKSHADIKVGNWKLWHLNKSVYTLTDMNISKDNI